MPYYRVSQVIRLLPGSGRGIETELQCDQPVFGLKQHRPRWGKGVVFGEDGAGWGHDGERDQGTAV